VAFIGVSKNSGEDLLWKAGSAKAKTLLSSPEVKFAESSP
jgi:hypothetical protein